MSTKRMGETGAQYRERLAREAGETPAAAPVASLAPTEYETKIEPSWPAFVDRPSYRNGDAVPAKRSPKPKGGKKR